MHRILLRSIGDMKEFRLLIEEAGIKSKSFVIKANGLVPSLSYAQYHEPKTLELLLSSLEGKKIVVDSYVLTEDLPKEIRSENEKSYRAEIREKYEQKLEKTGLMALFEEYDVEYINVTEEVWSGRTVEARIVKEIVERKHHPVKNEEFYGFIPQRLFDFRGSVMISFARIRGANFTHPTLSMKNLFYLTPSPFRFQIYGSREIWESSVVDSAKLAYSIIDVVKVYSSLFNLVGINEGIYHLCKVYVDGSGMIEASWGRYDVIDNWGKAIFGDNLVTLDAFTSRLFGVDPEKITYLKLASRELNPWDEEIVEEAKRIRQRAIIEAKALLSTTSIQNWLF